MSRLPRFIREACVDTTQCVPGDVIQCCDRSGLYLVYDGGSVLRTMSGVARVIVDGRIADPLAWADELIKTCSYRLVDLWLSPRWHRAYLATLFDGELDTRLVRYVALRMSYAIIPGVRISKAALILNCDVEPRFLPTNWGPVPRTLYADTFALLPSPMVRCICALFRQYVSKANRLEQAVSGRVTLHEWEAWRTDEPSGAYVPCARRGKAIAGFLFDSAWPMAKLRASMHAVAVECGTPLLELRRAPLGMQFSLRHGVSMHADELSPAHWFRCREKVIDLVLCLHGALPQLSIFCHIASWLPNLAFVPNYPIATLVANVWESIRCVRNKTKFKRINLSKS